MKKAFTILELIFVIVVIGILSAAIIPRISSNKLQDAAMQILSHIRYTRHLAIVDDVYDSNKSNWYKDRWSIRFKEDLVYSGSYTPNGTFSGEWAYTIYSDKSGDGNPNISEMAKNPLNKNQYLSGGYNNTLHMDSNQSMKELRVGTHYNINIAFEDGCRSNVLYLMFDHLGRPFNSSNTNHAYEQPSSGWHKLLTTQCKITLTDKDSSESISIGIKPETGYACILDSATNDCK
jgi:prepilin-type N-terminal cleavage/methylation domain-containing protein